MSSSSASSSGGIGVIGLLGVLFVGLKLCAVIDWSWLWVTAPFWMPLGIALAIFSVIIIFMGIAMIAKIISKEIG